MRETVLIAGLLFVVLLGVLTITVIVRNGLDPLTVISLFILVMFGIGLWSAVREGDGRD